MTYISPSKKKMRDEAEAKRCLVKDALLANGPMTINGIVSLCPSTSHGTVNALLKLGEIQAHDTGRKDSHSNRIYEYDLVGNNYVQKVVEKDSALWNIWPITIPDGGVNRGIVDLTDKPWNDAPMKHMAGIASCHQNLIMYCGE
jgi:hypothetical protein